MLSGGGTTGAAGVDSVEEVQVDEMGKTCVSVVESRLPGIGSDLSIIKGGDGGLSCKS
jgi:hypothetical protein